MNNILSSALAQADSKTQAEFFNTFYRHLRQICRGDHESQMCYIAEHLDENGRDFADSLSSFAKLAVESRAKHARDQRTEVVKTEINELYRQKRDLEEEINHLRKERENAG